MSYSQLLEQYTPELVIPIMIGIMIGAIIAAFFGCRLFKVSVIVLLASYGFSIGSSIGVSIGDEGGILTLVLGIAFAVLFGLIAIKIYKGLIYFIGGTIGAAIGFTIPSYVCIAMGYEELGNIIGAVVAIIFAILGAKLMLKIFKFLVIIDTALLGSIYSTTALGLILFGENELIAAASVLSGIVLAIVAMKVQFKMNKDRELFE